MSTHTKRDAEGYIIDPEDWSKELADMLAREENIELKPLHWCILNFMREFYGKSGIAPDVRHVTGFLSSEYGWEKRDAKKRLFEIFPYGYVKQACKIAGMRKPRAWSTG